jgi:SAM-dependent methyltransferase
LSAFPEIARKGVISLAASLPLWLQFRLGLRTSETLDKDVSYALALTQIYLRLLADRGIDPRGARILELGPGLDFAPQLVLASHGAKVTIADRFLANWNSAYHPEFYRRFRARWDGPAGAIDAVIAANSYPADVATRVAEPAETLAAIPSASCDAVISGAVLEHVYDLPAVCRSLARVTRPGGFGSHQIDFRDHWNFQRPLEFLLDDDRRYGSRLTRGRIARGNRHRLADHLAMFRAAGFQIEDVQVSDRASDAYLDDFLPRLKASSSPYRDRPHDDLAVLGARVSMTR